MPDSPPRIPADGRLRAGRHASLAAGDAAIALWMWFARCSFTGAPFHFFPDAFGLAAAAAGLGWASGLHRSPEGRLGGCAARAAGLGAALAALICGAGALHALSATVLEAIWLGAAAGGSVFGFRLAYWAARAAWTEQPAEVGRWLLLGAAGTAIVLPFYRQGSLGAGDAYWYVIMLADFVTQLRHWVFPIWAGQSEFAFNGAVSPLRLAPWLQHMGGLLDTVTARSLEPTALKNALICANALAAAAAAYLGLRSVLPRRPGIAALLALLWLASPGVLAPLYLADQFMTFMAMPFLPVLLTGCWRLWSRNDAVARVLIVVGLAGLWLSHTPIALWGSLLAAGMYAGQMASRRQWRAEAGRLAWMSLFFLAIGSLPAASALTVDNPTRTVSKGEQALAEVQHAFPENLKPIETGHLGLQSFQLGYSLMAAGAAALLLLAWLRPRGAAAFWIAVPAVSVFVLPVPFVSGWIWTHLPVLFVTINNVWPMQRLYSIWGAIIVFALALAAADERFESRRWRVSALFAALVAGAAWSGSQAATLVHAIQDSVSNEADTSLFLRPENLRLTRYSYAAFAAVPEYTSHGYVDPALENRLLTRATRTLMTANADAAAPRVRPDSEPATLPRLVQSGVWVGVSDNHSRIYPFQPPLKALEPGRHYALRLDFLHPERPALLQITGPGLFREYLLPDSGDGLAMKGLSMAFGSLPTSGRVIPLMFQAPRPAAPVASLVLDKYDGEEQEFARFWLFSYEPADLPIRVLSWVPYVAETETAVPAYLETPRVWQRGWKAEVNGKPVAVEASPHNLAMVPIEPGDSRVTLRFHAPLWLDLLFWIHMAGWVALFACGATRVARLAARPAAA